MRLATLLALLICLSACKEPAPKTGLMPGTTTGGYDAPSNAEASAAFISGFQARYDIPELDYPAEIKARIRQARLARLQKDMQVVAKRQQIMAKLALTLKSRTDSEAKELLEKMKDSPVSSTSDDSMDWMVGLMDAQPKQHLLPKSERNKIYQSAVSDYKKAFRNLAIENCRWTEMKRLIGSGHEAMAFVHGDHPTHGFECVGEMKIERRKGYPRNQSFRDFWVKAESGEWRYYGQFRGVGVAARQQSLDPNLLKNPEKTIARQNSWEIITSQLN